MLAATVLGSLVVARADDRVPVYVASDTLLPGDRLSADRLERREVQLDDPMPAYLRAAGEPRLIALGGVVPLLSFIMESRVKREVRGYLDLRERRAAASQPA